MASCAASKGLITFDEAWPILQEQAINKLIANLETEGLPTDKYFTSEEYMRFYTLVWNVAIRVRAEAEKLHNQYKWTFEDYISSKVLPSLRGKENENLLRELLRRWNNYKTMTKWLSRFFDYLSRQYIPEKDLPSLRETSHLTFYNLVFGEIKDKVSAAIISLIDREREGEQIDRAMVKQVLDIFGEIVDEEELQNYAKHIEEALVRVLDCYSTQFLCGAANKSYPRKVLYDIVNRFCEDCIHKVKGLFEDDKTRFSRLSRLANKDKVLEGYGEIEDQVCDAILSLMDRGLGLGLGLGQIHQAIFKQIRDIFKETSALRIYSKDIEEALVEATARYYSNKALDWIATKSYEDYMLKVEECLEKEKIRFSDYLRLINKNKVLKVLQHELLNVHAYKLEEKKACSRLRCVKL